jgi:hypothetical protein
MAHTIVIGTPHPLMLNRFKIGALVTMKAPLLA